MEQPILLSRSGGVLELRLNRPDKRNAITAEMYAALAAGLAEAEGDPAVRAVLIAGNGEAFTAGNDLNDFIAHPQIGEDSAGARFVRAIASAQKVLIAAVQGAAVGIGTTMLLHCDLVVAARGARLSLPFVGLGLVPEAASSLLLPRLIGHQRAAELLLLGEAIDAATAQALGLVNRVVDDGHEVEAARELARKVAAKPPAAITLTKRLMKQPPATVDERMREELALFAAQLASAELKEAVQAFFEKRPADFSRFS